MNKYNYFRIVSNFQANSSPLKGKIDCDVNSCKSLCRSGDNNYHGGKIPVDTVNRSRISVARMNSIKRDRHRRLQDEALGL